MKRLLEEAKKVIQIPSISTGGNEELANYVGQLLHDRGFRVQLQPVSQSLEGVSKRQFNVIGIMGDPLVDRKIRKGLLLCSHLDTVNPGLPEKWSQTGGDPCSPVIKDGKLYGLGASDSKVDFICKLHAAAKFRERKLRMPIYLVGTCGDELGMFGARYLIKAATLNPKYVVVGEPTGLGIVHAHKSAAVFRVGVGFHQVERDARGFNRRIHLHAFGRSGHAAHPTSGVNAILGLFDFLQRATDNGFDIRFTDFEGGDLPNRVPDRATAKFFLTSHQLEDFKRFFREMVRADAHERGYRVELGGVGEAGVKFLPEILFPCLSEVVGFFERISADFSKMRDDSYDPPISTVNIGRLKQNQGSVDLGFDLRLIPELEIGAIEEHIREGIKKIAKGYPSLNLSVFLDLYSPGLTMKADSDLVKICSDVSKEMGWEPHFEKKPTATEAAQFFEAGYESVVFGSGDSQNNSHNPNEYNSVEQMEASVKFYEKLIEKVCT